MQSALARLENELARRPEELAQAKARGKRTLGYFCSYIPEEVVWAAGLIPLRLCRRGDTQATALGSSFLTTNSCPFACSCVGLAKQGRDPYFQLLDVVADAPACLQMRRVMEVWERYLKAKVLLIAFPRKFYSPEARAYFAGALQQFSQELSGITGVQVTPERLSQAVHLFNHIRAQQQRMYALLKSEAPPLSWREVFRVIHAGFLLDREAYSQLLDECLQELPGNPPPPAPKLRILLAGGIMAPGDEKLLNILYDLGVEPIMDELCTGSRGTWFQVETPDYNGLAQAYLGNIPCGSLPYPKLADDLRQAHILRLIQEYKIQGVIYYTLRFCDAYNFKVPSLREQLAPLSLPLLHLNSDYSASDTGQMQTRVEAFIESLRERTA